MLRTFFSILVVLVLLSCSTDPVPADPDRVGYNYFPVDSGFARTYNVVEILHLLTGETDTSNYQIRELVAGSFEGSGGETVYLLNRLRREDQGGNWELDSIWSVRRNATQAVQTENNIPLLKMVFPVRENRTWDGNSLNGKDIDEYLMSEVDQPFQVDSLDFDQTLTVIQSEILDTIVFQDYRVEIYARDIGMIFKESIILDFCSDPECIGQGIIEKGRRLRMEIMEYGQ